MINKYFPHLNAEYVDASGGTLTETVVYPLFKPIFSVKTSRGPLGVPVWCPNSDAAKTAFGDEFLDKSNASYYSRTSVFIAGILETSGCYILRLGQATAGESHPLKKAARVVEITYDFAETSWTASVRNLAGGETVASLLAAQKTKETAAADVATPGAGVTSFTVPVFAFEATYEGLYGNSYGFTLGANSASMDFNSIEELKTLLYTVGVVKRNTNDSTVLSVKTKYQTETFNFALSEQLVDPLRNKMMNLETMVETYWDSTNYPCPITMTAFESNIAYLYGVLKAVAVRAELSSEIIGILTNRPYSVNLFTLQTLDDSGATMTTFTGNITAAATTGTVDGATRIMLMNGSDGFLDVSGVSLDNNETIEDAIVNQWTVTDGSMLNSNLMDAPRYPFNTLVDTGYGMAVKNAFIDFNGVRKDVLPITTTWEGVTKDMATSITDGATLRDRNRTFKESTTYQTGAFRGLIFGGTTLAVDKNIYRKRLPTTYEYCIAMARLYNQAFLKGSVSGTNAYFTRTTDPDWTPVNDVSQADLWKACVNYPKYYSNTGIHFPGVRSVYEDETSVYVKASFVWVAVFTLQLLHEIWAAYANVDGNNDEIYASALRDLNARASAMLSGNYTFKTRMYQTVPEANAGFIHHLTIELYDNNGFRILNADIVAKRNTDLG